MNWGHFFPWRLFRKLFLTQVTLLNILFVLSFAVASFVIDFSFYTHESLLLFAVFFSLSLVVSFWFSYRFSVPLRRAIIKALRIASKRNVPEDPDIESFVEEEPGEYADLESALDKIQKKLKKRRIQLAQEREESGALMQALQDAVFSFDIDEKVRFFNSQFATQFMTEKYRGALDAPLRITEIFREPQLLNSLRATLVSGEPQFLQIKTLGASGLIKYYSVTISPLKQELDSRLYGGLALFHDITEIKRVEQIRMEFVENASHELRTPLTSIKGYLATLIEDVGKGHWEQAGGFLKIISNSVDRLVDIVNDMLSLASLESGEELKKSWVSTATLTEQVFSELSPQASKKSIKLNSEFYSNEIWADASKIEQVLRNLVGNAIKYIPSGSQVDVSWSEEKDFSVLQVKDNGPGIGAEHIERLFERFYRVDKGRSRDAGGTGLGLAIVKHIIQKHGGRIRVQSLSGQGAIFICHIPKKK